MPHTPHSFAAFLAQLSEEARPRVADALKRHAVRQVATLKASGAALAHAPTLDDRIGAVERAKEELELLEQASDMYRELSGKDLLQDAEGVAAELPIPSSWIEASVAQLVLCLAARVDLDQHRDQVGPAFEGLTRRALAEEVEHVSAARAALSEACAFSAVEAAKAQSYVARWLPVALSSLDEDETKKAYLRELEREQSSIGLKK